MGPQQVVARATCGVTQKWRLNPPWARTGVSALAAPPLIPKIYRAMAGGRVDDLSAQQPHGLAESDSRGSSLPVWGDGGHHDIARRSFM